MRTYLVTHRDLQVDSERMAPWRQALTAQAIDIDGELLLEQSNWADQVDGSDRLLALGGDGTQSAVAAICAQKQALLGVLPAGTGNDFARSLGIPLGPEAACALLQNGREQRIDIARVNGKPFLNVAHVGIGAQAGLNVGRAHKQRWGAFSYVRQLLSYLFRKRGFWARVEYDGHVVYGRWLEIAVANGASFGGGYQITAASHSSGTLTLIGVRARPLLRLLLAWLAARFGRPLNRKILRFEHVSHCQIDTRRRLVISADGEAVGCTPMSCSIQPQRLRVILPV